MVGIEIESQQFVHIDQNKSDGEPITYPGVFEKEYTHTLMSTNNLQSIGTTYLPSEAQIHYRQDKSVKKDGNTTSIVFFNELGDVHVKYHDSVQRQGTSFIIDFKYDFVTKVHTDVYYTFFDVILIFIIIFPIVGFTLAGLLFLINIVYFYQHLT